MKFSINDIIKNPKNKNLILIIGCLGIVLLGITSFFDKGKTKETPQTDSSKYTAEDYADRLEQKLLELIANIDGAGKAQVMVTLESGIEYVYASEEKSNVDLSQEGEQRKGEKTNTEKKLILVENSDGNEQALVCTEIQPKVKGVVVICQGGDDPIVQQRVVGVVTTALDISSKKVCVTRSAN